MSRTAAHCIFCDLIQGASEVSVCYEDAEAIAFMDIQPVNGGHVLVVPRDHYESLCDVPPAVAMHLFEVSMQLAPIIRDVSGCGDMNLVVNSGRRCRTERSSMRWPFGSLRRCAIPRVVSESLPP